MEELADRIEQLAGQSEQGEQKEGSEDKERESQKKK